MIIASSYIYINQKDSQQYNSNLFVNSQGSLESFTNVLFEQLDPLITDVFAFCKFADSLVQTGRIQKQRY